MRKLIPWLPGEELNGRLILKGSNGQKCRDARLLAEIKHPIHPLVVAYLEDGVEYIMPLGPSGCANGMQLLFVELEVKKTVQHAYRFVEGHFSLIYRSEIVPDPRKTGLVYVISHVYCDGAYVRSFDATKETQE